MEINDWYTCYNSTGQEVQFSLNVKDIEIDEAVILLSSASGSKSFTLTNEEKFEANLLNFTRGSLVKLPGKNSGRTYIATGFSTKPDSIEIAPIISERQCEISDRFSGLDDCALLIN